MALILRKTHLYVLNSNQDEYIGQQIAWNNARGESKEVTVTLSGLLAASHLVSNGALNQGFAGKTDWANVVDESGILAMAYMSIAMSMI